MSVRVVDRVDDWNQRSFDGGADALQALADEEFSGVVRAGGAELYMTVGTVVGVTRGTIEEVASASGTTYAAPHPSLPLLAVMQEQDPDVRAQYYTEETPMSEVDRTLSDGGFTGFVELSENVLSGDYFLVYHGGESMSAAFVGESEKLLTGDEAFQTADDEVGIYRVHQVDVEPVEIPAAEGSDEAAAAATTADQSADATADAGGDRSETDGSADDSGADDAVAAQDTGTASVSGSDEAAAAESEAGQDAGGAPVDDAADRPAASEPAETETGGDASAVDSPAAGADTTASETETESSEPTAGQAGAERTSNADADARDDSTKAQQSESASRSRADAGEPSASGGQADGGSQRERGGQTAATNRAGSSRQQPAAGGGTRRQGNRPSGGASEGGVTGGGRQSGSAAESAGGGHQRRTAGGEAGDLETRAVPSLDPGQTEVPSRDRGAGAGAAAAGGTVPSAETGGAPVPEEPAPEPDRSPDPAPDRSDQAGTADHGEAGESAGGQAAGADRQPASGDLAELEAEIDRLEAELATATDERDDLEAELEAVRDERDELQAEVDRLDEELQRLEEQFGAASGAETRMTPPEAIEGTNLFVDYHSKGKATLGKAHGGTESREEVGENLQIGVHTEFEDATVAVGGQAFDEFLRETLHHRFAAWVVGDLLFEIRDTGHAEALADLYDAIPEIRRVEFNGTVDIEYVEDGQEKTGQERFDVIFRHRMGDPLIVANLNDARDPATGGMMDSLVTAAERVGQSEDTLAAAFLVTSSFFESEALETVSEATRSGILSRDSRASFVNLSRKSGYHLCLTAAREGNFHMEVPEL